MTREQALKIQTKEEARAWLYESRVLDKMGGLINTDMLKAALLMLIARKDVSQDMKEELRAVAIGLDEVRVGEAEKLVMETVGKAMEEYREVLENMVEATVKTVKGMAEQAKE
ncbi:hypothetical protein J132_06962 [Termitomyces sp. J132]|nr:hypothetical protein J132_06962 [Termitomyces sp. J132]